MTQAVEEVEEALAPLQQAFVADGANLTVRTVSDGTATIELITDENTCMECIVPPPTLVAILSKALVGKVPSVSEVSVIDPRAG
jgi:Fe-S cluster biogenesis protein NfuA